MRTSTYNEELVSIGGDGAHDLLERAVVRDYNPEQVEGIESVVDSQAQHCHNHCENEVLESSIPVT